MSTDESKKASVFLGVPPILSHNAVAGVVQMYQALIAEYERREMLWMSQVASLQREIVALKKDTPPNATRIPNEAP